MSYSAPQITEKGKQPRFVKKARNKIGKKFHHRRLRRKNKDPEFVPRYNRYDGGWHQ
jgi:hypothetical protein